jgi:Cytochrome c554 and c-prime
MHRPRPSLPLKATALVIAALVALGVGAVPERISDTAGSKMSLVLLAVNGESRQPTSTPSLIGVASCSARACHGSLEPTSALVLRNEYTTWLTRDPHAQAFRTLRGERSQAIAARLAGGSAKATPADENTRCLACHAVPSIAGSTAFASLRSEGVSCEACHGDAERWRIAHTLHSWDTLSPKEKEQAYGMTPLRDPADRAQVCAGCHVGAVAEASRGLPARDVNHDLIAAGHPRLTFELSAFLADMPRHWVDSDAGHILTAVEQSALEARLWASGQVASAQAALRLLASRAQTAMDPWPEFAEYDCFACHHDLHEPSWRQSRGYANRTPGAPVWGTLSTSMLPRVGTLIAKGANPGESLPLDEIEALKGIMARPRPDSARAALQASQIADQLDPWLKRAATFRSDRAIIRRVLNDIIDPSQNAVPTSWDLLAQNYLAGVALRDALRSADNTVGDPHLEAALKGMADELALPPGYASPKTDSPPMRPASKSN